MRRNNFKRGGKMPAQKAKKPRKMATGGYNDAEDYQDFESDTPDDFLDNDDKMGGMSQSDYSDAGSTAPADYQSAGQDPDAMNDSTMAPFKAQQTKQQDALQLLRDAQKRAVAALNPPQDKSAMYLAIAQGLLSPTRTGGFAESLGNAAGGAAPFAQHYADADAQGKAKISDLDYSLAQNLYNDASKPAQIIDWYARDPSGAVGKQKAMMVDGVPVPFGEIFTPQGGKGTSRQDMVNWYNKATPQERAAYDRMYAPKANQSVVNVQSSVPFETESQKKAADRLDDLFKAADTSRNLSAQLNAVAPYIAKTPDYYFGPGGKALVTIGKTLKQSGLYDAGEGLDNAGFVDSIMSHLGPAQRIVGSGSSSDRDVALFMNSLPSLSQTPEGNKMLIKYYNKLNDYNQKLVRIIRSYAKTHQDFYGIEDLPTEEINKAGRVFSDDDLQQMQGVANSKVPAGTKLPKGGLGHVNVQEDDDGVTIELGK